MYQECAQVCVPECVCTSVCARECVCASVCGWVFSWNMMNFSCHTQENEYEWLTVWVQKCNNHHNIRLLYILPINAGKFSFAFVTTFTREIIFTR